MGSSAYVETIRMANIDEDEKYESKEYYGIKIFGGGINTHSCPFTSREALMEEINKCFGESFGERLLTYAYYLTIFSEPSNAIDIVIEFGNEECGIDANDECIEHDRIIACHKAAQDLVAEKEKESKEDEQKGSIHTG